MLGRHLCPPLKHTTHQYEGGLGRNALQRWFYTQGSDLNPSGWLGVDEDAAGLPAWFCQSRGVHDLARRPEQLPVTVWGRRHNGVTIYRRQDPVTRKIPEAVLSIRKVYLYCVSVSI